MMDFDQSLEEWAKDKPLSILQLDPADRAVLRIADERDAIQKKTFTKWVNKHLTKTYTCLHVCAGSCSCDSLACGKRVGDLFEDLRDGHNLVSLLEVLSGDHLPRERGRMRFHMLQNVQTVLDFLRYRKIKLVNIRAEDIVDGNPKLTLGLIWTIILHFQISDIVVGMEENMSAKDALLKWAQRTTAKYPGVRVDNFTNSWRDGLAFSAVIHRNRPDLIDWRTIQRRNARDRLETAFTVAERDCGVTRLLDAEDVDTPQPDEKSLITYISSLYDAFPEPSRLHPLYDTDSQKKWEEYREIASNLYTWTRQHIAIMQDRHFSSSLIEMRKMAAEMNRFRVEEVPPRAHDKQRLAYIFNKDLEKHFRDGDIDRELHMENVERSWQLLMLAHQEKDQAIHDEIKKLEKLQRIAEKLQREVRQVETRLDEVEQRIEEEARRIDRLHPLDAKHNCDQLEREMQLTEDTIKSMFTDAQTLRDARYHQATDLHKMVQQLHQRWINVRTLLHNRLLSKLASISFPIEEKTVTRMSKTVLETRLVETNQHFRFIQEVTDWIRNKHKQLQDSDYGSDLPSVQAELEKQLKEHKSIEKFQSSIEKCSSAKNSFQGDELQLYINYLNGVQKAYADLLMSSKKRQSDLETLMDFVQSATNELIWLSEKEEREITRDWSSKNLNLVEVEQYYEALMSELEKREIQFNAVQDRGESLVLQHHPASKCIETYMSAMQTQWSWLLQLTLCLETHLKYVATYQQYFADVRECEQQVARKEEMLNSIFSKSDFTLDEGEVLLKDMQDMRDELTKYGDFIQGLTNQSREIIPLKQRKTNVNRPISVTAICNYKQNNQQMVISKDERCTLQDNSQRVRWRVINSSGLEGMVPGVCFLIPPPDKESLDAVERIRRQYDRTVTLWQKKQLKMRQNMIFATIKVVKSWDLSQFLAMGSEQRNAIRKALNEDAEKLIQEGDPNDPALKRLRREIDEVNRLFDEFEKKASEAERSKNTSKIFLEQVQSLQSDLDDTERSLLNRVNAPVPRDVDSIERLVIEHKEFEMRLQSIETRVETVQRTYATIPQKTSALQSKLDKVVEKWDKIWGLSHLYVERLKCVEIVLTSLEETTTFVSSYEMKLSSYDNLPADDNGLSRVRDDLFNLQNSIQAQQHSVDQLIEDTKNVRRVVEKSRPGSKRHPDVDRIEDDVNRTTSRFSNVCTQVVERLRTVESSTEFATKYNSSYQTQMNWLDSVDTKTKSLPLVEGGGAKRKLHPHMTLYNTVVEEKVVIEQINTMGARLAKEAKTYDKTLESFRHSLEEFHPSLDGSLVKHAKVLSADQVITQELDLLNLKYQLLVDNLYHKIQQLTTVARQEDPTFELSLSSVPAPSPLKTYRLYLTSHDSPSPIREIFKSQEEEDVVDFVQQKSTANVCLSPVAVPTPKKRSVTPIKNGDSHANGNGETNNRIFQTPSTSSLHFAQIRSAKRIERVEEGISTETATQVPVVIDPATGDALTLAQAIGCGLIDIKSGMFCDPNTNQKISLQEAAERGYIEPSMLHKLLGVSGLVDPQTGKDLTLLDAIRNGYYDISRGGTYLDPQTGSPITTEQAIRLGIATRDKVSKGPTPVESSMETVSLPPSSDSYSASNVVSTSFTLPPSGPPLLVDLIKKPSNNLVIDVKTGHVSSQGTDNSEEQSLSLVGAYNQGLFTIETFEVSKQGSALSDLLDQGLISHNPSAYPQHSIRVQDRFSGKALAVSEAVDKQILNPHLTEVFHPLKSTRVSVQEAIDNSLIDEHTGLWDGQLSLPQTQESLIIMKPLSLRDCCELNLIKNAAEDSTTTTVNTSSIIIDPITKRNQTVLEAVQSGMLDTHSNTISDTSEVKLINLQEALVRGIVTPEGLVRDTRANELNTVGQAAAKGLLSSVKRTSIFTIPCILDSSTKEFVSLGTAVEMQLINAENGTMKDAEGNDVLFEVAAEKQLINPQVYPTLQMDSGFFQSVQSDNAKSKKRPKKELTVLEAVITNTILPTGEVVDAQTKVYCPMDVAVEQGSLDPEKANFLKGLYNINLTTASVTTTIRHRITVQKKELTSRTINFQDALVQGYIDNTTGFFTNPETGQVSTIEEAVIAGSLALNEQPSEGVKQAKLEIIPGVSPPTIVSAVHKITTPQESLQVKYSNSGILPSLTTKIENSESNVPISDLGASVSSPPPPAILSDEKPSVLIKGQSLDANDTVTQPPEVPMDICAPSKSPATVSESESRKTVDSQSTPKQATTPVTDMTQIPQGEVSIVQDKTEEEFKKVSRQQQKEEQSTSKSQADIAVAVDEKQENVLQSADEVPGVKEQRKTEPSTKQELRERKLAAAPEKQTISETVVQAENVDTLADASHKNKQTVSSGQELPEKDEPNSEVPMEQTNSELSLEEDAPLKFPRADESVSSAVATTQKPAKFATDAAGPTEIASPTTGPEFQVSDATTIPAESKLLPDIRKLEDLNQVSPEDLLAAVLQGKVDAQEVKVRDPSNGKEMSMNEAINKGVVDKDTGEVQTSSASKMSFADALKIGAITLAAAPLALVAAPIVGAKLLADKVGESLKKKGNENEEGVRDSCETRKVSDDPAKTSAEIAHNMKSNTAAESESPLQPNVDTKDGENSTKQHKSTAADGKPADSANTTVAADTHLTKEPMSSDVSHSLIPAASTLKDAVKEILEPIFKTEVPTTVATEVPAVSETPMASIKISEQQPLPSIDDKPNSCSMVEPVLPQDAILEARASTEEQGVVEQIDKKRGGLSEATKNQESVAPISPPPSAGKHEINVASHETLPLSEKKDEFLPVPKPVATAEALSMELLQVPPNGWQLVETIDNGLLDPIQGLLTIPGTDRMVSFEECIHMRIIDPSSAEVIDAKSGRRLTLVKALEKQILDGTGHYSNRDEKLNLKEAIALGYVVPTSEAESDENAQLKPIPIEAVTTSLPVTSHEQPERPETLTLVTVLEGTAEGVAANQPDKNQQVKLEISAGMIFDPNTGTILDEDKNEEVDLLTAILEGKIKPTKVKVRDPISGKEVNINEAIRKGMVDKSTGKVKVKSGPEMTLLDAVKMGTVAVVATPVAVASPVVEKVQTPLLNTEKSPDAESNIVPEDEVVGKKLEKVSEIINYEERQELIMTTTPSTSETTEIVISEEIIPVESVITTTTTITTTTVIITKVSRIKVRPEQLVEAGIVDTKSAEILSNPENFKGPGGEELDLKEALALGKIDGDSGAILELQTQQLLTINEAVTKNVFDKDGNYLLPVGRSLSVPELKNQGLYDPKEQKVIHPETGGSLTITQAIASDVLNPFSPVNDPVSKKRLSLSEAVEKNVVCNETGNIMDPRGEISLLQAVDSGTYDQCTHPLEDNLPPVAMTIPAALKRGLADLDKGTMRNPITEEEMSIEEAVEKGMVMVLPKQENPSATPIKAAVEQGLVDLEQGLYTDPKSHSQIPLAEAVEAGIISIPVPLPVRKSSIGSLVDDAAATDNLHADEPRPITTTTAVVTLKEPLVKDSLPKKIIISPETASEPKKPKLELDKEADGKLKNLDTGEKISILEAVENNLLDPANLLVTDPSTGKEVPLETASKDGKLDVQNVQVMDPISGKKMSFKEGLKMGLLAVVAAPVLAGAAIIGAPVLAGKAAVDAVKKLSDKIQTTPLVTTTAVSKDDREESKEVAPPTTTTKAIEIEIKSQAKKPLELVEHQAEEKEESVPWLDAAEYKRPYPLQVAVALGNYSPETGLMKLENSGEFVTLQDAIEKNEIDGTALTCRDPRTGNVISLTEAIDAGLIQTKTGQAVDPVTGAEFNLDDAIHSGLLITPTTKTSLPEAIYSGKYNPASNTVTTDAEDNMPLKKAIENKCVSVENCLVKNFATEEIIPFNVATTNDIINLDDGTVKTSAATTCNISEGLESGWLVEVKPPLSLSETILKGLYQPCSSLFLDPKTGDHVNLDDALKKRIVDSNSVHVKDTREGFVKKMPLKTAIEEGFVSGEDGSVKDFEKNETVPLLQALESGLIIDSRMPISLQKAIHLGLYSEETGRITDPNTGNNVTLHEAIRRLIVNPNLPCYWSEDCGKLLSLVETCRIGIIDRQQAVLRLPQVSDQQKRQSQAVLTLGDALSQGYIVDIESAFSLYQALKIGLYDRDAKKFVHPSTGKKLTLEEACKEELVNPETSIVKNCATSQLLKLNDAISSGLINPFESVYNVPKENRALPLDAAREKGFVLTTERPLSVLEIIRENLYSAEIGKIADPLLCDWLNVSQAIDTNLVDPTTTAVQNLETQQIKSFVAAIDDHIVNVGHGTVVDERNGKQLSFDDAARKNIIISVAKPVTFGEAVKENYIDFKRGTFFDPRTSGTSPLHEAIESEAIEAGSAVVREPVSNNFRNLRESIKTGLIDVQKRALVHPESGKLTPLCIIFEQGTIVFLRESITFDTARDKNYLDVTNGQFSDPSEKSPMTMKEAIDINAIDPNSVVVKDTLKKRLVKFPEAYSLGLIDPDKSTILNTAANVSVPLNVAIENKLVLTPRNPLSLIGALDYSMYNPRTGRFTDPYAPSSAPEISLNDAINSGLIEPNTTVVKDPKTGNIIPLERAIAEKIIDGEEGWLTDPATNVRQNLLDAWKNGLLVAAEARLAIEAQYRNCDNTMTNLTEWLQDIEKRLASQETLTETVEELKRQTITVKNIRDEVDDHSQPVGSCLDQVRHLVSIGGDVLSSEEITSLERNGKALKTRYDRVVDQSEKLLRKVTSASDELRKYKTEVTTFTNWMDKAVRVLDDKERNIANVRSSGRDNIKEFVSDVIAHQGDLRFISMSAQKFVDKSRDYTQTLNDFRASLPQRLSYLESRESTVQQEVKHLTSMYQDLLNRANRLDSAKADLENFKRDRQYFNDQLDGLNKWLNDMEDMVAHQKPPSADFNVVKAQLQEQKLLNKMLSDRQPSVTSLFKLGKDVAARAEPAERAEIEGQMRNVGGRYDNLCDGAKDRQKALEAAMKVAKEFQEKIGPLSDWLDKTSRKLKDMSVIPSDEDKIQRRIKEHDALHENILKKRPDFNELLHVASALSQLIGDDEAIQLETQLKDLTGRYGNLVDDSEALRQRLRQAKSDLRQLVLSYEELIKWMNDMDRRLNKHKVVAVHKEKLLEQMEQLADLSEELKDHEKQVEDTVEAGLDLMKNISNDEAIQLKEKLDSLQRRFSDLTKKAADLLKNAQDALPLVNQFHDNHNNLNEWMSDAERLLQSLDGSSVQHQEKEIKILEGEIPEQRKVLDLINLIGPQLCQISPGEGAAIIDGLVTRDNRRFDSICEQVQRSWDRLQNSKTLAIEQQYRNCDHAIADLTDWLQDIEKRLASQEMLMETVDELKRQAQTVKNIRDEVEDHNKPVASCLDQARHVISIGADVLSPEDIATLDNNAKTLKTRYDRVVDQSEKLLRKVTSASEELKKYKNEVSTFKKWMDKAFQVLEDKERNITKVSSTGRDNIKEFVSDVIAHQGDLRFISMSAQKFVDKSRDYTQTLNDFRASLPQRLPYLESRESTVQQEVKHLTSMYQDLLNRANRLDSAKADFENFKRDRQFFNDQLDGLNKWLHDMEDTVAHQKPPSADFNVVKAQLQEQKLLNKMISDRQPSVTSLFKLGKDVAARAEPAERAEIEGQMKDVGGRYDNLADGAKDRQKALEVAMKVAKEFQDKIGPLSDWLDKTSRKLKDMSVIPSDEDKIQRRIKEHDALHDSILKKQPDFNELLDIASALTELVGDEEAAKVEAQLKDLTDRYGNLVDESEALRQLLRQAKSDLRHLVLSYEELVKWMNDMDRRLSKHKVVAVHKDKLLEQMEQLADLTDEIKDREKQVDETVESGLELMKSISNDEAIQLKEKLDSLQRRFNDLTKKAADLLKNAQDALPLVTQFHENHNNLSDWMLDAEGLLQSLDGSSLHHQEKEIKILEGEIQEQRKVLDLINLIGPQLCQMSPGEGASTIEGLVTRDNRRFDAICEQVQRRAERIQMAKSRSMEVLGDIDDLLDWFRSIEGQIKDAEKPSCEPDVVRLQLQEHRALNDEINSQKGRVRDVLATAKKVLREAAHGEDTAVLREKADDLKETMESVSKLSTDRLNALEQALPLAEHFFETHGDLNNWMDAMEDEMQVLDTPAIRPDQIMKLQDKTQAFLESVNQHKPLVDKLNKTGGALIKLCNNDDAAKVQDIMDNDNDRYNSLRVHLREKQQELDKALQETNRFEDKLDGMLNALESTADQVNNADPISAYPDKIREQIDENAGIIDDMKKREDAFNAVKNTAADVIAKAPNKNDPAVKEIRNKLDRLNSLWDQIQKATKQRGKNLDAALLLAEKFWEQLQSVMEKLEALQETLKNQDPPAVEPKAIQKQQDELKVIKKDIDKTKPEVGQCRQTGQNLLKICGDQDKPEIKKNIEDLDSAWDNITALFAKREENLIDAMEKAMEFHDTLQSLLKFLDRAEERLAGFDVIGADIDAVKKQIRELKDFKNDVDPMMVKVESLNRQAHELTERTSPDQAAKIKGPLSQVNRRWDNLLKGIVDRQRELENALLRLGQFQHALQELMAWIDKTNKSLDSLKPVFGDPQVIEVELAKLKVVMNDIEAHQNSVHTLNDAGRQIIEAEKGSENASNTRQKLNELNKKWDDLQQKANGKHKELEDALREAHLFNQEIQDLLLWLGEVDSAISSSKPTGGLPETAAAELARFMEIYDELEANRPKVEAVLQQGQEYLKKSTEGAATNLAHNLRTLKQRWESVLNRANDKKIKLEIALKEANEFHKAVQDFIEWLTEAERYLAGLEPVSRVLPKVVEQVESHKEFQKEIAAHREVMVNLDKKGNHLKYFSQKQDVILIKNLLISVQHRWDRVVSKSTERTRALDLGLKEAKEFHDAWTSLCKWLDDAETQLDEMSATGNNPVKIKQMLAKHKEFQKLLSAKQPVYDNTMKMGKNLKDKAPKTDEPILRQMLTDLKNKWNAVCNKSVERQRNLEEALLRSGQFKDALQELLDWLKQVDSLLVEDGPVHGDLDTVLALIEQHKKIEEELQNRRSQMNDVVRTAEEMMETASPEERERLRGHVKEIKTFFDRIKSKCDDRSMRLEQALREAERLHKAVHMLLEWLSDAEMKLRFAGSLPEDEESTRRLLEEQEKFMRELMIKEKEKDDTIDLARSILAKAHPDAVNVIKHWISIIQSRWDEISSWAKQRGEKLSAHLASLRDMEDLLEELMNWLQRCEDNLTNLEAEPLPDDLGEIQILIKEHKEFMEGMAKRQPEIDSVCKPKLITRQPVGKGKPGSRLRSATPGGDRENSPELDLAQRRISPGREKSPELFPHIGPHFDRRGSKAIEPQIKNPKVKALWDKWKHVWMMAWERQRRLQDKYNYLLELEKVKNFSWEDWRKRFLKFMNHKKSRVTDLFRKIDRNNNGLIPREEFIDAIMKTKFPTSRLEMNAVADMFDHGDHLIDYMEFIAALRPDWEEKKPVSEADIVDDEIQRQVMKCTCRQKFRVFQVGEGKYRFGDSQKLRLVRILRSTVMVRVGGGWVALDEFLVKNDPCRAKGRTNIELREQFILADGVSQTMTAFKSKASGSTISSQSGNRSAQSLPAAGPITKVKERSIRSVPMGRARSTDRTTPDSTFSDDGFSLSRLPRKSSGGPGGRGSTPGGSRPGSKPPSRTGSNQSLDSTDDHGSRIPIRRTGSLKRGTTSGLRTPLASSTPVSRAPFSLNTNVNTNGASARGRSPSASSERALSFTRPSSAQSAARQMQRTGSASSLSSMTNFGSRPSRIPVFVGGDSLDLSTRSRTPSNSNIPVAVSSSHSLSTPSRARTPSGSNVTFAPGTTASAGGTTSSTSRSGGGGSGDGSRQFTTRTSELSKTQSRGSTDE